MSSIRPLVTITFLALVGVFLYLKINETEPELPEEFAEFAIPMGVEISDAPNFVDGGATDSDSLAPQFSVQVSEPTTAPAYQADTMSEAPPAFVPKISDSTSAAEEAPKFDVAVGDTTQDSAPTTVKQGPENDSLPDLPPLPAIPSKGESAATEDSLADSSEQAYTVEIDEPAEQEHAPETEATEQLAQAVEETTQTAPLAGALVGNRYGNYSASPQFDDDPASAAASYPSPATSTEQSPVTPTTDPGNSQSSLFAATRLAVQAALDRGELSQALLLLSDWHGDPSLTSSESREVEELLGQLAGSVIYSTEHRIEPPYMVQSGETLEQIGQKHNVPWQLLAKINGLTRPDDVQPGQQLKVVRGPFSARVDLTQRKMTLMLDRRYAGQFALDVDPETSIEEGYWSVNEKLVTPGGAANQEERSLLLTNSSGASSQVTLIRGPGVGSATTDPSGRVLQLNSNDVSDVFDILTVGSQVIIRR